MLINRTGQKLTIDVYQRAYSTGQKLTNDIHYEYIFHLSEFNKLHLPSFQIPLARNEQMITK